MAHQEVGVSQVVLNAVKLTIMGKVGSSKPQIWLKMHNCVNSPQLTQLPLTKWKLLLHVNCNLICYFKKEYTIMFFSTLVIHTNKQQREINASVFNHFFSE